MKAKTIVAVVAGLVLAGSMARECKANSFFLDSNDPTAPPVTVDGPHDSGTLHYYSKAKVVTGGDVDNIDAWEHSQVYLSSDGEVGNIASFGESLVNISGGQVNGIISAFDSSTVNVDGGTVYGSIIPYHTSVVNISGGQVSNINTSNSVTSIVSISGGEVGYYQVLSPANISGGQVTYLETVGSAFVTISGGAVTGVDARIGANTVAVSGGQVDYIFASNTSILTFDAQKLFLGPGLLSSGNRVWGEGVLEGNWDEATKFITYINGGSSAVVPEPATAVCGLIGLGMIGTYIKKHRASKA